MDNIKDDFRGHIQKIMIKQVIQQSFCGLLIRGIHFFNGDMFFGFTNTRKNVQNDF